MGSYSAFFSDILLGVDSKADATTSAIRMDRSAQLTPAMWDDLRYAVNERGKYQIEATDGGAITEAKKWDIYTKGVLSKRTLIGNVAQSEDGNFSIEYTSQGKGKRLHKTVDLIASQKDHILPSGTAVIEVDLSIAEWRELQELLSRGVHHGVKYNVSAQGNKLEMSKDRTTFYGRYIKQNEPLEVTATRNGEAIKFTYPRRETVLAGLIENARSNALNAEQESRKAEKPKKEEAGKTQEPSSSGSSSVSHSESTPATAGEIQGGAGAALVAGGVAAWMMRSKNATPSQDGSQKLQISNVIRVSAVVLGAGLLIDALTGGHLRRAFMRS